MLIKLINIERAVFMEEQSLSRYRVSHKNDLYAVLPKFL